MPRSDCGSPPISLQLLGPPALIPGEEAGGYDGLLARITDTLQPADVLEEIWTRDVVDLVWDALRLRRLKATLLSVDAHEGLYAVLSPLVEDRSIYDITRNWARRDQATMEGVDAMLVSAGLSMDAVMAKTLELRIAEIERIERMIASAEVRRSLVLREIERHRAGFAQNLRRTIENVEEAELKLIAPEEISEREPA
jgi:hypothetical protein